jgi:phenylalanyl-tRNA synthetase beta chain
VRLFEIGRVFSRDASAVDGPLGVAGVSQPMHIGGLAFGPVDASQWGSKERNVDFFDVKGDLQALFSPQAVTFESGEHPALHPGRSARLLINGEVVGHVGELHPRWKQAYELPAAPVVFEVRLAALLRGTVPAFVPLPRQQSVWRDIAVVADDSVSHASLVKAVHGDGGGMIRSVNLFDVFRPQMASADLALSERSLAVRIELLDDEVTLTDERIDAAVAQVIERLQAQLGVRLRGA